MDFSERDYCSVEISTFCLYFKNGVWNRCFENNLAVFYLYPMPTRAFILFSFCVHRFTVHHCLSLFFESVYRRCVFFPNPVTIVQSFHVHTLSHINFTCWNQLVIIFRSFPPTFSVTPSSTVLFARWVENFWCRWWWWDSDAGDQYDGEEEGDDDDVYTIRDRYGQNFPKDMRK